MSHLDQQGNRWRTPVGNRKAELSYEDFPLPGQFLRPVGLYLYCFEVVVVRPADDDGPDHWTVRRWGLSEERQPYIDEGPRGAKALRYLTNLTRIGPGIWKDESEHETNGWKSGPRYYRQIEVGGQMELFS